MSTFAIQPALFSLDEYFERAEQRELTGEGVKRRSPELYAAVKRMATLGFSLRLAGELTGISKNTVAAIYSDGVGTAELNSQLASRAGRCAMLALDAIEQRLERPDNIKTSDLAVMLGIIATHLPQMQGGPSMTVKVEHTAPQFSGLIEEIRTRMGLAADSGNQRAETEKPAQATEIRPAVDMESSALSATFSVDMPTDTVYGSVSHSGPTGEGGVSALESRGGEAMDLDNRKSQQTP